MRRNILFICTQNRLRSPTAEQVFADWPGIETASAGLGHEAGAPWALVMEVADYPANFEQKIGGAPFFEVEIHRVVQRFGNIAQVFSTYEAWRDAAQTDFIKRGINSIQLYNDGQRWRVANMIWDDERPGLRIDPAFLPPCTDAVI